MEKKGEKMRKDHSHIRMKPNNFIQYFGSLFDRILTVVKTVNKSKIFYISVNHCTNNEVFH